MPNWIYRVLLGGLFGALLAVGIRIAQLSLAASDYYRSYYSRLGVGENIGTQAGYFFEGLSLGVIPAGSERESVTLAMLDGAQTLQLAAEEYSWLFLWIATALVCLGLLGSFWPNDSRRLARCLILVAGVCMVVGQVAPIMSMTVTSDVPIAGNSVVKQESKSILTAALALHRDGKTWVAALIALFSFVTPALKLVLAMVASRVAPGKLRKGALWLVQGIGKWSMADVFVVALLLTMFSLRSTPGGAFETRSNVEVGLWFFASHCVLAMVATFLVARSAAVRPILERGPGGALAQVFQLCVCVAVLPTAMALLKPAMKVRDSVVVDSGFRWSCSVIAHDAPGWLRGSWRSSGQQHGGADDTMVHVAVMAPDGNTLKMFDHQSAGSFDLPIAVPGIYSIVLGNAGIIRETSRSAEVEMRYEPVNPWTWPF